MKNWLILIAFLFLIIEVNAQKYITKNGNIRFYSETPVETIEAINQQVNSALDRETGDFVFKVLIKSFEFEKSLMQEHFNENYMESDKFPNAMFKGKVLNISSIDFNKDGTYDAEIEGEMTIHGVTKQIKEKGAFEVKEGRIIGTSIFKVAPEDYDIKIPKAVMGKIADNLEVTVKVILEEHKK
jgi:polyisoprenoid-binding protein YceI